MTEPALAELLARCRDKGFTPGARDVAPLLAAWRAHRHERRAVKAVAQALARGQLGVARELTRSFAEAEGRERALRLRALAQIARRVDVDVPELGQLLPTAIRDREPRVVREAVRAVAKLELELAGPYEGALIDIATNAALPERRAAVEALGRVGGPRSLAVLDELASDDPELARRITQAQTLLRRRADRDEAGAITRARPLPRATSVVVRCRGAAKLVADEARARLPSPLATAITATNHRLVTLDWTGSLAALQTLRTALDFGLVFALPPGPEFGERILAGLEQDELLAALHAWTEGPVRFRLSFVHGGSRSATTWRVAEGLRARDSALTNDSRGTNWTVEVDEQRGRLICLPRHADPRFDYRVRDIPAASHPTLAALMARVADPRPGERIWDPYCGCGTELIECARLAADLRLRGSDRDADAIAAARANFDRAQSSAAAIELVHDDVYAASPAPASVDAIVTNPPMGRRVAVDGGVHDALRRFVAHAAEVLRPGGRLVWVTPAAKVTATAGRVAGLHVDDHGPIDMSGLRVVLQVMRRSPK